jgi:hypothetical protein
MACTKDNRSLNVFVYHFVIEREMTSHKNSLDAVNELQSS